MRIREYFDSKIEEVDDHLRKYILFDNNELKTIYEAMGYSLLSSGKRLRPILVLASCETFNDAYYKAMPAACSIEMIHTYSLIHDDLPCMDNDDYRRGKLTSHKVFGEAIAVLAGDGLLTLAFEVLIDGLRQNNVEDSVILNCLHILSIASGPKGMVGGQSMDLLWENRNLNADEIESIHNKKTGALLAACVKIGGIIGGAGQKELVALTNYGEKLGLAFQVIDDVLDIKGEQKDLGKTPGSDKKRGIKTYPQIIGLEEAEKKARELIKGSKEDISSLDNKNTEILENIADFVLDRDH